MDQYQNLLGLDLLNQVTWLHVPRAFSSEKLGRSARLQSNGGCGCERKSRCSSRTSNASLAWDGSDYVVHAAQMMNSCSPQPPRTSGNWLRSFLRRSKRAKPDRKGARARFGIAISAFANVSFSTEWAETGLSLRSG